MQSLPDDGPSHGSTELETVPRGKTIQEQTLDAVTCLVENTRRTAILHDGSLLEHLAQIYRGLGENRTQIQLLTRRIAIYEASGRRLSGMSSRQETEDNDNNNTADDRGLPEFSVNVDCDAADVFWDCVSRFSEDHSDVPMERMRAVFSGTADYFFESGSVFYPEQYTISRRFNEKSVVVAIFELQRTSTHSFHKYFLFYAENVRSLRRITVTATILRASHHSAFPGIIASDYITPKTLPGDIQTQLEEILRGKQLRGTVNKASLTVTEDSSGKFVVDRTKVCIAEDLEEIQMIHEDAILQDIEDMGCPQYLESEVIIISQYSTYAYIVQVESRTCMEQKMPFAGPGFPGEKRVGDFLHDIKSLSSMTSCKGLVKFVGVVLDDTRRYLKSYLHEWPAFANLGEIFAMAEAKGERIPWSIRETWAKQITAAMADLHAQGFVVNVAQVNNIDVKSDGSTFLIPFKSAAWEPQGQHGQTAPELRTESGDPLSAKKLNFRADIFQLGFILWLLAVHRRTAYGYHCSRNACTSSSRNSCRADHANPVDLPPWNSTDVPKYFGAIIRHCRQTDPKARIPARELLQFFPRKEPPPGMVDLITKYPIELSDRFHVVACDECGTETSKLHYHCHICKNNDFDLCPHCVEQQRIHCYVSEHQLVRRITKNGKIVHA
jgi:serine/threonine protein kinase